MNMFRSFKSLEKDSPYQAGNDVIQRLESFQMHLCYLTKVPGKTHIANIIRVKIESDLTARAVQTNNGSLGMH